ncbi:hypothetical protein ACFXPA_25815 [Amycolatopsis sp. NPDC059090]|uniref:hypothetical protein n=1 Tax=unclassified Amycolatopsis TaxID=2618356 RepID=UPI00366BD3F8
MTDRFAIAPPQLAPVRRPERPRQHGGARPGTPDESPRDVDDPPGWLAPTYERMKTSTLSTH